MAKKQTFISKLGKEKKNFKFVKYIQTLPSEKTGHIKFLSRMIRMEENENIDQALKREEEESRLQAKKYEKRHRGGYDKTKTCCGRV